MGSAAVVAAPKRLLQKHGRILLPKKGRRFIVRFATHSRVQSGLKATAMKLFHLCKYSRRRVVPGFFGIPQSKPPLFPGGIDTFHTSMGKYVLHCLDLFLIVNERNHD